MGKMTNAPELLSRLREASRCMALPCPSAADELRIACRALAQTTEAESPEIEAAGLDLAKAAEAVGDRDSSLRLHLAATNPDVPNPDSCGVEPRWPHLGRCPEPRRVAAGRREVPRPCSGAALVTGILASPVRSGRGALGVHQLRLSAGMAASSAGDGLLPACLAARHSGGRHHGKVGGLLRPHARRLSAAVPVSSPAEDDPGVGGVPEHPGGAALSGWASSPLCCFWRRAEHLRSAGESLVRGTELRTECDSSGQC